MSKSQKKLDIKEAISWSSYNDNIKRILISFLISNYCKPKNELYLFSRGKNLPKIILLKLIIPARYNNKLYEISLLIYFPVNFPFVQPEIYFHKYCTIKINPKCLNYIDEESLKINYNIFFKWENNFQSFNNLIKEIKQIENKNINSHNKKIIKNEMNENNKINNIISNINNININHNLKKSKTIIDNRNHNENKIINNDEKKDLTPFNENISKESLKKLLILDLYPKISEINYSINDSRNYLNKIKKDIINELNILHMKEKQAKTIEKSMNLIKNEINSKDINNNINIKNKINFSNLDSFLKINNKKFYILQAKQKSLEEYLLIIKKNLEKKNIEFKSGITLTRRIAREIFYIKYKCFCLTGTNI